MSKYSPRVLPEGRSPIADFLGEGLRGFDYGLQQRRRAEDRKEQGIDRTRRRGREDVTWEQQDELHGFAVEDQEFDRFDRSRDIERDPMFTTDPAQTPGTPAARNPLAEAFGGGPSPGQYVPGVGFLPPMAGGGFTPPAEPGIGMQRGAQQGGLGIQEGAVAAPMAGAQEGPQTRTPEPFATVGGRDIYRNPDYVPEEERARAALVSAIEELQDDDPTNDAAAIASLPDNLRGRGFDRAFPEDPEEPTITMFGRRFPDTPEGERAALAWRRQNERTGNQNNLPQMQAEQAGGRAAAIALDLVGGDNPTMPDPTRASRYIMSQLREEFPDLPLGTLQQIAISAVDDRRATDQQARGRDLTNQNRQGGGSGGVNDLLAGLDVDEETPRRARGPRLPGGKQPALAADGGGEQSQAEMWDAAAAVLRQQGKDPTQILGPRP